MDKLKKLMLSILVVLMAAGTVPAQKSAKNAKPQKKISVGLVLCGGGAKSPIWRKIIAAVMNMPVDIPVSEEGPSMGGAMLAAVACGEYRSVQDIAEKLVRVKETIEPDRELVAKYEAKYRQFKQMYPALKPIYDVIKAE